jgi:hypothetical protein
VKAARNTFTDVAALFIFRKTGRFLSLGFNDFLVEALDCPGAIKIYPALQFAVRAFNIGELSPRQFRAVFCHGALLFKVQKMPTVRRQRFDEIHRHRAVNDLPSARKIGRQPPGYRRSDPD